LRLLRNIYLVGGLDYHLTYTDWPSNDCNVYLVDTRDTLVMVDCGCGETVPSILTHIRELGLEVRDLSHVLLTHEHLPHSGGAEALRKAGANVISHQAAAQALNAGDERTSAFHYHKRPVPVEVVMSLADGAEIEIGEAVFRMIHLPGHSPGSCAYEMEMGGRKVFFTGDVVMNGGMPGRCDNFGFNANAMRSSLLRLLKDFTPDCVMPGHGPMCFTNATVWIESALSLMLRE